MVLSDVFVLQKETTCICQYKTSFADKLVTEKNIFFCFCAIRNTRKMVEGNDMYLQSSEMYIIQFGFMVFNTTFNNISVISWWCVYTVKVLIKMHEWVWYQFYINFNITCCFSQFHSFNFIMSEYKLTYYKTEWADFTWQMAVFFVIL
jgi:hypothetical protein